MTNEELKQALVTRASVIYRRWEGMEEIDAEYRYVSAIIYRLGKGGRGSRVTVSAELRDLKAEKSYVEADPKRVRLKEEE